MNEVGIVNVLERKEIIVDEKKIVYYEVIGASCGFYQLFASEIIKFVCISNEFLGNYIISAINEIDISNNEYLIFGFKTIRELAFLNDNYMDMEKFMNNYYDKIGNCYTLTNNNEFVLIIDENILSKIKSDSNSKIISFKRKNC